MNFGQIQSLSLKDVWPGEATHFTPWLAQNLDVLADKLAMELTLDSVEVSAGDFSADIVARDLSTNRLVVIENQYGRTDHCHLGQIITYASVLGASAVVWIAESIRQEHKTAINFLNQYFKDGLQFYALEVSVIKIDDSRPAYAFNVACAPADITVLPKNEEPSEIRQKYRAYFQGLIDELRTQHQFTNARVGQPQNWYTFASENSRIFTYSTSFAQRGRIRAEVYIDCGDKAKNEALFDVLYASKAEIEAAMGAELDWERLDNRRACRIALYRDGDIDVTSEVLDDIKRWSIAALLKFKAVFPERIFQAHRQTSRIAEVT
jgi:hypothetical protein